MKNKIVITKNFTQTQKLGEDFSKKTNSKIFALHGELGSGKTTFVQGLAKGLGIKNRIISPTFLIIRSYIIRNKKIKAKYFYHIDLYRIDNKEDVLGMEIEEIIKNPKNIIAIEWPEKIKNIFPKKISNIYFKYLDENKRSIEFK